MTLNGRGVRVAVCGGEDAQRGLVAARLGAAGHEVVLERESLAITPADRPDPRPGCVVMVAARPNKATSHSAVEMQAALDADSAILVCESIGDGQLRRALSIGVSGVVLIDEVERALSPVVSVVGAGQVSVPRSLRASVRAPILTTREKQILGLVVMGMSNGEIAAKLYLAESTVKSHLSSAFAKLGVSSRNEAVSVILDPDHGRGLGILGVSPDRIASPT